MTARRGAWLAVIAAACGGEPAGPAAPGVADTVAASVAIARDSVRFGAIGSRDSLAVVVRNAAGDELPARITWSHARAGVVAVDSAGRLTALANGEDTLTATSGSAAASVVVVVAQVPVGLTIGAHASTFTILGDTITIPASVTDSNGVTIPGAPGITWTSSDPPVVTVADGRAIAAGEVGTATVTASVFGADATTELAVVLSGPDGPAMLGQVVPCTGGAAGPFPCSGLELLAYLPKGGFGAPEESDVSDLWGWTDPVTGDEWALVGHMHGTAFVNVTDPTRPTYAGTLPHTAEAVPSWWRDIKVYADHAYIVSDGAGPHGVQVFDLGRLRSHTGPPGAFSETVVYRGVESVHNIAINEATGFAYAVGSRASGVTCGRGLHMIDLAAPAAPVFAGCFADSLTGRSGTGYTHDTQCVTYAGPDAAYAGREICFGLNETALSIADVTDKANPVALSRATYPSVGYVHQGWLSDDHRHFYSNDEIDEGQGTVTGSRTIIWDVMDLDDPLAVGEVIGPTLATDHNLYVHGSRLYASNYQFGIRVLDIGDPTAPTELAWFDTAPSRANVPGFGGSWSNYPFFASGILVVTSRDEGLFILRIP